MRHRQEHLTESELLSLADGEMSRRQLAHARSHIDSCWNCRERFRALGETIGAFVRARNDELDVLIPPAAGPRALLRAGMEQLRATEPDRRRYEVLWRVCTGVACMLAVAGFLIVFERSVNAEGPRPDVRFTPGEIRQVSLREVCSDSRAQVVVRDIPEETRLAVLAAYGIPSARVSEFEVDYLITPDLGGADSPRNMWPQPYSVRWNARVKDRLEQRLHNLVCEGRIDLAQAQHEIATDWIGAYRKYVDLRR